MQSRIKNFFIEIFSPLHTSVIFVLIAFFWVKYSRPFFEMFVEDEQFLQRIMSIKDYLFVAVIGSSFLSLMAASQKRMNNITTRALEQEERYHKLVDSSPYMILVHQNGKVIFINKSGLEQLEFDRIEDVLGRSVKEFLEPEYWETADERSKKIYSGEEFSAPTEYKLVTSRGNFKHIESIGRLINFNDKPAIQLVAKDISGRLMREQALEKMVREKTLLLSEVHHRVKNNMAIISGLMQLQSYETGNEEVAEILDESVSRIKSIALIHENLYEVQNLSEIKLDKNIRDLVEQLSRRYSKETDVWFNYDLKKIKLNINQAVSVGLFINEVITEIFKASVFSVTRDILISTEMENEVVTIRITENLSKQSIGRQHMLERRGFLIDLMAQQLNGKLTINQTSKGFELVLSFSRDKKMKGSAAHQLVMEK